ncbi:MAG TPA: Tol-Pal system beta propeller repeat protein TolB [Thermoanaerobaculia bacterium]|nr:Tol-Pal system beta propeller repeat protein TolB [Thermoanaerobaculia bacterium]
MSPRTALPTLPALIARPIGLLMLLVGLAIPVLLYSSQSGQAQAPPARPPGQAAPATPPATVQPPPAGFTIESNRGQKAKIKLAVPAFRGAPLAGDAAGGARELEETLRADLDVSGYFDIQAAEVFKQLPLDGDLAHDLPLYHGSEIVLLGDLRSGDDKLIFEGRLYDIGSGKAIVAKRYSGKPSVARRMAHTFADEVVHYLTGALGIALSEIAFSSDRTDPGRREIFLMDYDGRNQRRLTGHRSTSMSPAWSPSGDAIAYTSFLHGSPGLYIADLATGGKRSLVTSGSLNISPSFSPDGSRIAFARSLEGNIEIFTCDRNGGNLRRLTNSPAIDTNPAWSPKGNEIAFTSSRAGSPQIYLMDAEGTNTRRISFEGTYNDGAAWSPDGGRIAYTSRRDGAFQIAVVSVSSLETRVLTSSSENESPAFSPDGRKIVFTSRRTGAKQLFVMDAQDGGNVRQLTDAGANDMADWSRVAIIK